MLLFCGQEHCLVDGNNRIRLTQRIVDDFTHNGGGTLVLYGLPEGALALYPENIWHQMRAPVVSDPAQIAGSFSARSSLRRAGALTLPVEISPQGRITLPEPFLHHAGLQNGKEAVIVGVEIGVEIWSADRFEAEMAEINHFDQLSKEREWNAKLNHTQEVRN